MVRAMWFEAHLHVEPCSHRGATITGYRGRKGDPHLEAQCALRDAKLELEGAVDRRDRREHVHVDRDLSDSPSAQGLMMKHACCGGGSRCLLEMCVMVCIGTHRGMAIAIGTLAVFASSGDL